MKVPLTHVRFLYRALQQFGRKTGVIDGDQVWTYAEYTQRCHQLANLLRSWSLGRGTRVAYLGYNDHTLLEAYYGVVLAGAIFLPLNIRLREEDFVYILNDSEAEALFFHSDFLPTLSSIREQLPRVRKLVLLDDAPPAGMDWLEKKGYSALLEQQSPELEFDVMQVDEDSVAELFYTSGTTGNPKGVMLTHRNLFLHALEAAVALDMKEEDVYLHTIPLFHVNGWGTPQFVTCLGGTHVMMEKFEPQQVLELIQRHRVTCFSLVPTMAIALVNFPGRENYDVSSVRMVTLGGAAANPGLVRQVEETFGCLCLSGYGMTETSPILTLATPKSYLQLTEEERHTVQAMTGWAIPGVELEILGPEGRRLPWDGESIGEIVVRADSVMEGYWKLPQETSELMRDGWFHTGDMATINPDGYVLIVDRKKDIIISGGENISSLEVEKALLSHPAVLECAVIPVPDSTWGEVPLGLVVLKEGMKVQPAELIEFCRSRLAHFKCPRRVEILDVLPKGGTGKILKRELREKYWSGHPKRVH